MSLNSSIGNKIANLRRKNGMTQEQLAEELDISIKHCSSVERGLSCLSLEKLIDISYLFDVSIDFLVKEPLTSYEPHEKIFSTLPQSTISILTSKNEEEIQLFHEYLRLYAKIRNLNSDEQ